MEFRAERTTTSRRAERADSRALESLLHEAAALLDLVDFIESYVREQDQTYRYSAATRDFFQCIQEKAQQRREDVIRIVDGARRRPERIEALYRPALPLAQADWALIHTFVKPAADAHSLSTPDPLIRFAVNQLHSIPVAKEAQIVMSLTSELMYFQKDTSSELFPPEIGFVEIPYSQGTSFFSNINIYHEIGHFVYQMFSKSGEASLDQLDAAMEKAIKQQKSLQEFEPWQKAAERKVRLKGILENWTKEVFCDLFAVRLIGPAFTFALIDLYWIIGLMRAGNERRFDEEHPSPALRLREQLAQLTKEGWWPRIGKFDIEHVKLIRRLSRINKDEYVVAIDEDKSVGQSLLSAFLSVLPTIQSAVQQATKHIPRGEFAKDSAVFQKKIEDCLLNGTVPSWAVDEDLLPGPVAIINTAYIFQLTKLGNLMDKLSDTDRNLPADRMKWRRKVEAWTMKALEDFEILKAKAR
ncbi:MAG TPA: hypothetical protein VNH18_35335 [Bryobacteraceae bacterium]|nr:hypothetical protein [Bryobacteraceae bacterium]HXJ44615.1 hypothetical protein [Bryobacteraceae bacterium]